MKKDNNKLIFIILRYLVLILLAINSLWLFYFIFTPLTIYPILALLKLFSPAYLSSSLYNGAEVPTIIFSSYSIQLVQSCIAGAAYYLLVALNLTTPMNLAKRIKSLSFILILFLFINILRISIFSLLLVNSFSLFNTIHMIFWYFLSSIFIIAIWIAAIKLFNIKEIPVYSDLKFIYSKLKKAK